MTAPKECWKKQSIMQGELADNIEFLCMDAQKLDFEDNTFDVIVTRNLRHRCPKTGRGV